SQRPQLEAGRRRLGLDGVQLAEVGHPRIERRDNLGRDGFQAPRFDELAPLGIVVDLDGQALDADLAGVPFGEVVERRSDSSSPPVGSDADPDPAAGVDVRLIAVLPDEIEEIAITLREHANRADLVLVTGGLGGTPDDLTREAVAAAFGVVQTEYGDVAADLRARFRGDPEYAARW